jgi:putative ATPase
LQPDGIIVLAEAVPRHTQRLYRLLNSDWLDADLYQRLAVAEEAIYARESDPLVNWDAGDLRAAFEAAGLAVKMEISRSTTHTHITPALLERWFAPTGTRPTYAAHLSRSLSEAEILTVKNIFSRHLRNQTVIWESAIAFVRAHR